MSLKVPSIAYPLHHWLQPCKIWHKINGQVHSTSRATARVGSNWRVHRHSLASRSAATMLPVMPNYILISTENSPQLFIQTPAVQLKNGAKTANNTVIGCCDSPHCNDQQAHWPNVVKMQQFLNCKALINHYVNNDIHYCIFLYPWLYILVDMIC